MRRRWRAARVRRRSTNFGEDGSGALIIFPTGRLALRFGAQRVPDDRVNEPADVPATDEISTAREYADGLAMSSPVDQKPARVTASSMKSYGFVADVTVSPTRLWRTSFTPVMR